MRPIEYKKIALGLLAVFFLAMVLPEPAHALLFDNTEKFFNKAISNPAITTGVVRLGINIMRVTFVIFGLFAIIQFAAVNIEKLENRR